MSNKTERDDELWALVSAYEEATEAAREIAKQKSILKDSILRKLSKSDEKYRGNKRVRKVTQKSTEFSTSDLRRKYGEQFVEENKITRHYTSIDIRQMAKRGPKNSQC